MNWRMDSLVLLLGVIFTFVLIKNGMDQRNKAAADRLRVLEQALKSNADPATLATLVPPGGAVQPAPGRRSNGFQALLLALGWLTLFTGLGIWLLGWLNYSKDAWSAGVLVSVIGFGLVTYPFALKELEARRSGQS